MRARRMFARFLARTPLRSNMSACQLNRRGDDGTFAGSVLWAASSLSNSGTKRRLIRLSCPIWFPLSFGKIRSSGFLNFDFNLHAFNLATNRLEIGTVRACHRAVSLIAAWGANEHFRAANWATEQDLRPLMRHERQRAPRRACEVK